MLIPFLGAVLVFPPLTEDGVLQGSSSICLCCTSDATVVLQFKKNKTDIAASGLQYLRKYFPSHRLGVKTLACFHLFNFGVILK